MNKLPDTIEELDELADMGFKVLSQTEIPQRISSTTYECLRRVRCPFCGNEFNQTVSSGCFHYMYFPFYCPECNFPRNVHDKIYKLYEQKKADKCQNNL